MSILDRIIEYKREFVAKAKQMVTLAELEQRVAQAAAPHDFLSRVRSAEDISVIAEIKKASPSKGLIRPDFDPVAIGKAYQAHGAAAISCLTDEKFFQGSLGFFMAVRAQVNLPMLRKEFIIDEYQIVEARAAGADLVLLITSILSDQQLRKFRELIEQLGMTALVETHSAEDARRAVQSGARLIGINNRDLDTENFQTNLRHTETILPLLPTGIVRVSESGIRTPEDVDYLRSLGVEAILVGEQLMRQKDPGEALINLLNNPPARQESNS